MGKGRIIPFGFRKRDDNVAQSSMEPQKTLVEEHHPQAIRERLEGKWKRYYLGDAVLGAIDGCVTTFAIVAGVLGGKLSAGIALLLGLANLLADGFSMAVSNFQKSKSEAELIAKMRRTEERHIDQIPEGEKEEIRQIFFRKGFQGEVLQRIVEGITQNRKLWIDTMLQEEYGLSLTTPSPWRTGGVTFLAFVVVGFIPIAPFVFAAWIYAEQMFQLSFAATAIAFFGIGAIKGSIVRISLWRSGLETLLVGSIAAGLAYGVGYVLRELV